MLVVGDYIRKRSFNTFGTETDSKPVIKISSLSTLLGSKGGFSRWIINGVYHMLPSDFIIISEDEAIRIMGIWENSAEISPVANDTLNTKCIREDNGKPKVTYHGKAGWRKPLFNFRMKNPHGGFQAYKCPECGKIHIGKTMEIPGGVKHISQTLLEFTNDQLMESGSTPPIKAVITRDNRPDLGEGYGIDAVEGISKILRNEIASNFIISEETLKKSGWVEWKNPYTNKNTWATHRIVHGVFGTFPSYLFEYDLETNTFRYNGGEFSTIIKNGFKGSIIDLNIIVKLLS
jgi:hypothetical protein